MSKNYLWNLYENLFYNYKYPNGAFNRVIHNILKASLKTPLFLSNVLKATSLLKLLILN